MDIAKTGTAELVSATDIDSTAESIFVLSVDFLFIISISLLFFNMCNTVTVALCMRSLKAGFTLTSITY